MPFFYLVYRAWSHWRALSGGKHVQWLVENKLILPSPSETLDRSYAAEPPSIDQSKSTEQILLTPKQIENMSQELDLAALEPELERAVWQVQQSIEGERTASASTSTSAGSSTPATTDANTSATRKDQ